MEHNSYTNYTGEWVVQDIIATEVTKSNRLTFVIEIEITPKMFWALLPAINLNMHSREIEFEWLCIGIYISKSK